MVCNILITLRVFGDTSDMVTLQTLSEKRLKERRSVEKKV